MDSADPLAREALRKVLSVRRKAGVPRADPVCVFDIAGQLGIEVVFAPGNSFEGVFARESGTILVAAQRPPGRQAFTCAHELGHWAFDHGTRVDELDGKGRSSEERLATLFAGYFLMPPWAVSSAFADRGWTPEKATPLATYTVACQFGVGYETLVQHLRWSLGTITARTANSLLRASPKSVRESLLGSDTAVQHLVVVDPHWRATPVDLRVGDAALVPADWTVDGNHLRLGPTTSAGKVVIASAPGISRIGSASGNTALFVRVSRPQFEGRSRYRHLEDPDEP